MTLKTFIGDKTVGIIKLLNDSVIKLIFALAIFFFIWNVFKLITEAGNSDEVAKFKSKIVWGLVAIAAMVSMYGLINLITRSTGLETGKVLQIRTGP